MFARTVRVPLLSAGAAAALVLACVFLTSCRERKPQIYVEQIEVDAEGLERSSLSLKEEDVRKLVEVTLKSMDGYRMGKPEGDLPEGSVTARIRADAFVEVLGPDVPQRLALGFSVLYRQPEENGERVELEASFELKDGMGASQGRKALQSLMERLARSAQQIYLAQKKTDTQLERDLRSKDPVMKDAAVRVLVLRKNAGVVPALEDMLKGEDPAEVRRAIGSLVELKSRASVGALIELSRGQDWGFLREVIFALGAIGGDEAEAYLFTVSQGHYEPLIRDAAGEALSELRAAQATPRRDPEERP